MGEYLLVTCPRCGALRITKRQKTFSCYGCGVRQEISPEHVLAVTRSPREARSMIASFKARQAARSSKEET